MTQISTTLDPSQRSVRAGTYASYWARLMAIVLLAIGLGACATDKPLATQCPRFDAFRVPLPETPGVPGEIGAAGAPEPSPLAVSIAQSFAGAAAAEGERPSQFLILSGGGQWGAFGAGFIKGWSDKGTGEFARPDHFDVVTGVSTGSLQATFAFLGKPYDKELLDAYAIADERQLLKRHGSLFFIRHASMADIAPLEKYVRARLRPMIEKVAASENARRQLYVGVVDALDGRMYAVDLTRMARELTGKEREDCYVGSLLASSAVPVVFRQVQISGHPYLDGGVRQSVFITDFAKGAHEALDGASRKGRLYVLMNGDVRPTAVSKLPPKLLPTLNRLRGIVFNQVELTSIFGAARTFPEMQTFVATAAGHDCKAPQDEEDEVFSPTVMRCLSKYGSDIWSDRVPWQSYSSP